MVILVVARLFSAAVSAQQTLRIEREALTRRSNSERWLKAAFLSLEVGVSPGDSFGGQPHRVAFATWRPTARGWMERHGVVMSQEGRTLRAQFDDGIRLTLADSVRNVAWDYLLEPGANTHWVTTWSSPVSAPLAVRLRLARLGVPVVVDTMLLLVKGRG
jgi:hypothetical protein